MPGPRVTPTGPARSVTVADDPPCPTGGMTGYSGAVLDEVIGADYRAIEQVAQDGSLMFSQWVEENRRSDPARPARLGDFAELARAEQRPPRKRPGHLPRATVRDTRRWTCRPTTRPPSASTEAAKRSSLAATSLSLAENRPTSTTSTPATTSLGCRLRSRFMAQCYEERSLCGRPQRTDGGS